MRIAVLGASGFVGSALVERLVASGDWEVMPFVHSSGNAWRIARLGLNLSRLDLLARADLQQALRGCSHIVNCTRGDDEVMLKGFRQLLDCARQEGVQRFVHLSSVAVYGDPPVAGSETEDARGRPAHGSYGWVKLRQDQMLQRAAARGMSAVAICPPNIGGPYSPYLQAVLAGLRRGRIPMLDGGRRPCNLVDADNLAHAIELALHGGPSDGRRLFVTDGDPPNWRQVVEALRPLLPGDAPVSREITASELTGMLISARPPGPSIGRSLKHLVSSDVREVLRRDPLLATLDRAARRAVSWLGARNEQRLRTALEGPNRIAPATAGPGIDLRLASQQLRTVIHSSGAAFRLLGYRPLHSTASSLEAFKRWYLATTGLDATFEHLYAKLYS